MNVILHINTQELGYLKPINLLMSISEEECRYLKTIPVATQIKRHHGYRKY